MLWVNYEALVMLAIIIAGSWLINRPLNAVVPHAECRMPHATCRMPPSQDSKQSLHLFLFFFRAAVAEWISF